MKPHTGGKTTSNDCNSVGLISETLNDLIDDTYTDGNERYISWCIFPSDPDIEPTIETPTVPYEVNCMSNIGRINDISIGDCRRVISNAQTCDHPAKIAEFHTHPCDDARFSSGDYSHTMSSRASIACLGTRTKSGENIIVCDSVSTDHEKYEKLRNDMHDIFYDHTLPASHKYATAIENGSPFKVLDDLYEDTLAAREVVLSAISTAIDDGVIRRCSTASNLSKR